MAIDTTTKAFDMALQVADYSSRLMADLRAFVNVAKRADSSGISFAGVDYADTQLKYCSGDDIQAAITNAGALLTYLETNFIDDIFDKVTKA